MEAAHDRLHQPVSPGIVVGGDGVLRWVFELDMWKNPTLVITIWRVLLLAASVPALLVFFLSLGDGAAFAVSAAIRIALILVGIVTGLMVLAYPLVALFYGGKYCVAFEMDENGVKHIQMQKQFNKSQVLSTIVTIAGGMAGSIPATASGLLAGSRQSTTSRFGNVRSILVNKKRHVLYVNEMGSHNQVYAASDDFAFVCDYITRRCPQARVRYQS